ncbi:hypothetical protein FRB98_008249 [Tulasnella sp. 332]|nr:hypothetical protein FRB98_008249 [Tulasnella sp. 332]
MRILDVCIIGFWDEEGSKQAVPRWRRRKQRADDGGGGGNGDSDEAKFITLPLPSTWQGRLAYTVDSLLSFRGSSLFKDCSWDWAPRAVRDYNPPNRAAYFRSALGNLIIAYVLLDLIDNILVRRQWNLGTPYPVSSLPALPQLFYTLLTPAFAYTGNVLAWEQPMGLILVMILRFPVNSCPPLHLYNPLEATSLAELWGYKWHTLWRRTFDRMSLPALWAMDRLGGDRPFSARTIKFVRAFVIFAFSALLHVGVTFSVTPKSAATRGIANIAWVLVFFLAQPFGLLFENTVVHPNTETLPKRWKGILRRSFVWVWMVWLGRLNANWFALLDGFGKRRLDFSPVDMIMRTLGYQSSFKS